MGEAMDCSAYGLESYYESPDESEYGVGTAYCYLGESSDTIPNEAACTDHLAGLGMDMSHYNTVFMEDKKCEDIYDEMLYTKDNFFDACYHEDVWAVYSRLSDTCCSGTGLTCDAYHHALGAVTSDGGDEHGYDDGNDDGNDDTGPVWFRDEHCKYPRKSHKKGEDTAHILAFRPLHEELTPGIELITLAPIGVNSIYLRLKFTHDSFDKSQLDGATYQEKIDYRQRHIDKFTHKYTIDRSMIVSSNEEMARRLNVQIHEMPTQMEYGEEFVVISVTDVTLQDHYKRVRAEISVSTNNHMHVTGNRYLINACEKAVKPEG